MLSSRREAHLTNRAGQFHNPHSAIFLQFVLVIQTRLWEYVLIVSPKRINVLSIMQKYMYLCQVKKSLLVSIWHSRTLVKHFFLSTSSEARVKQILMDQNGFITKYSMTELKPVYRRGGLVFSFLQVVPLRRIPAPGKQWPSWRHNHTACIL